MVLQKTARPAVSADAGEHSVELLEAGRGGDLSDLEHPPHVIGKIELERVADGVAVEIGQGPFAAPQPGSGLLHLVRRKAVGQPGEFLDRLAHRLIGDLLGGLDEIDVDRDPARIDPLVELPNCLFGRRQGAEPLLVHHLKRENIDAVIFDDPRDNLWGQLGIGFGLAVRLGQTADETLASLVLFDRLAQRRERLIERSWQGEAAARRAQVDPSPGRDRREPVPLNHDPGPHGRLEAAEAGEHRIGVGRQASSGSREGLSRSPQ